jgi:nucleoside-triphosphatase
VDFSGCRQEEAGTGREGVEGSGYRGEVKNLLVEGRPGVGKTTLVRRALGSPLPGKAAGFFTKEKKEENRRTGFEIETLDGKKGVLASADGRPGPRVGRYTVNMRDLEEIAAASIEEGLGDSEILIIDEIGTMELSSERFRDAITRAFDSRARIVATIRAGGSAFTQRLKDRNDTRVLALTESNRDEVLKKVIGFLEDFASDLR